MAKATINDVAKLAGVSIKTVSRVVNSEPNVRPATRAKVNAAIETLSYLPSLSARSLAGQRSRLIMLVYEDPSAYESPSEGFVVRMQQGALRAAKAANFELLIHPCNYRDRQVRAMLRAMIERTRPDGVILAAPLSNMTGIVAAISETNTPLVRLAPGRLNAADFSVATDDRQVSAEMTRYLASLGHSRIAFVTGHKEHKAVQNRFRGYTDGLRESGLVFAEELVAAGDNSIASGEAAAEQLLTLDKAPTAVFAANDDMAAGVIRAANRRGLGIPDDLSVAGFDDSSLAMQLYPALTTVRQPLASMAECASRALIGRGGNPVLEPGTEILPSKLTIRESTGPAAV